MFQCYLCVVLFVSCVQKYRVQNVPVFYLPLDESKQPVAILQYLPCMESQNCLSFAVQTVNSLPLKHW